MSDLFEKISTEFWTKQTTYPGYDHIKNRRWYELDYTLAKINQFQPKIICDLGCGTGSTITLLRELTDVETYYGFDCSQGMLNTIDTEHPRGGDVILDNIDFTQDEYSIPASDLIISYGLLQCLSDDSIKTLLSKCKAKYLICRNACERQKRHDVITYSNKLKDNYGCAYRTQEDYVNLLRESGYSISEIVRCYPDEIESDYGTKQFFFTCKKDD